MSEFQSLPSWFHLSLFALLGAILGSFANVIIYRLPRDENIAWPSSHCRKCNTKIRWFDNIPILSYVFLKGQCRNCKERVSLVYPIVEILMSIGFVSLYLYEGYSFSLFEHLLFFFSLVVVSFIDFEHMILPDSFTLSGIVIGLIGAYFSPERYFLDALIGFLFGGGFLWAVAYLYFLVRRQEGMGGGDIKLLAWIGAVLGWQSIPFVIFVSCILGSLVGIVFALRSKKGMQTIIPFGPYLALSAVLYILGGYELGYWYLKAILPNLTH